MNFLKSGLAGLLGGLVVVLGFSLFQSSSQSLGGTSNFNTVDADTAFSISGTTVIDSSRNIANAQNVAGQVVTASSSLTVGTANASIEEIHCTSVTKYLPLLLAGVTSTFGIPFTGVETSTNQVYIVNHIVSSTAIDAGLRFSASATTTNGLQIIARDLGGGTLANNVTLNACYFQF